MSTSKEISSTPKVKVTLIPYIDLGIPVDELIHRLTDISATYRGSYTNIEIEIDTCEGAEDFSVVGYREETDYEKTKREERERIHKVKQEEYERKEYLELHRKVKQEEHERKKYLELHKKYKDITE